MLGAEKRPIRHISSQLSPVDPNIEKTNLIGTEILIFLLDINMNEKVNHLIHIKA